jgi:predicted O-methyltransferase YrrM
MPDTQEDPRTSLWEAASDAVRQLAGDSDQAERVARLLVAILPRYLTPDVYKRYFTLWQQHGFHITPVQYYFPIPDTRTLPDELWARESALAGVEMNPAAQLRLLEEFGAFEEEYNAFPHEPTGRAHEFHLRNDSFDGTDALAFYCMIRHTRPRLVLEIGSGYSSRLASQALLRNGEGRLVCVDPDPDPVVLNGLAAASITRRKAQDVHVDFYGQLRGGDILFIDSSHVVACGSDVTYLFLEVIPRLAPGVLVHVHDVFLPFEYPKDWVKRELRFWGEQYLLQAFLAFNREFEVVLCNSYLAAHHRDDLQRTFPKSPWWGGGSFWLRRRGGEQSVNVGGARE